ncbi:9162_t:CDS:2, partial [Funneliformis geosporum]
SDDDFMPVRIPKRKQLSLTKKNKESVGSAKKVNTPSSSHGVPAPSSSQGVPRPSSSSSESARSSTEMTGGINENNSPEYDGPNTTPHRIFSYDASSGASARKDHDPKDGIFEDGLLTKSPYDIVVDCKLTVNNVCVRSKMEQWRCSSKYVEELHKQDLMRYNILDTTSSSATEARNLFKKDWDDIDIEQDGRADDVKQYIKSISKNVNTAKKLRDVIRIECEKLRENGNTIWRKRVLDLMETLQ